MIFLSESQTVITSSIRLAYTLRSGQRRISRFPVTEHGSQWCIHLFLCHDHLATRAWMIECRPRSPHWHCGRARETLPAEIRRARNGVKVQRANARSTLGFCWLRAAQCAHRRSHWFVYWVVGDSEVGSHLPRMTLALSPNVYLTLMRTLFPPSMPDSERKTGFPENDRIALLKRKMVLSPWR